MTLIDDLVAEEKQRARNPRLDNEPVSRDWVPPKCWRLIETRVPKPAGGPLSGVRWPTIHDELYETPCSRVWRHRVMTSFHGGNEAGVRWLEERKAEKAR